MTRHRRHLATARRRQDDIDRLLEGKPRGPDLGAVTVVGQTGTSGSYPVTARSVYRIELQRIIVTEKEGQPITYQALGRHVYAANLGTSVPPLGTPVEATLIGGKYVFTYF